MPTDLYIKSYPKTATFYAGENFAQLVRAVSAWTAFEGEWTVFRCGHGSISDNATDVSGPLASDSIILLMSKCAPTQENWFYAATPFRLWRYHGAERSFKKEFALLEITAWGPASRKLVVGDLQVEGNAQVSTVCKPYWAILGERGMADGREFNGHVAENLLNLKELFSQCTAALSPKSMKLFVDEGWTFPWNSHLSYWNGYDAVIDDIATIAKLWESARPYDNDALNVFDAEQHLFAFSTLRTPEQRRELWQALNDLLPNASRVSPKTVADAIAVTNLVVERLNSGFSVRDDEYFVNSFIQNFYLNVLAIA